MPRTDVVDRDGWDAWVDSNPLRRWRKSHQPPISIMEASARVGVSMTAVVLWEKGSATPGEINMAALTALIGKNAPADWDAWTASKPRLSA